MAKIKVAADTVLAILKGIMNDEEINRTVTDKSAPEEWQGKKVQDILNVDYYTFKHRPMDTELLVGELIKQGQSADALYALTRGFCILSLTSTDRVYSKENDIVTVSANLEYWVQTEKIKLLEDMFEDIAVETTGIRIPVQIGTEERQAVVALGALNITELQETSEYGEMAICEIDIDIIFHPNVATMSDYKIEFLVEDKWVLVPVSSIALANNMNQKAVPYLNKSSDVGNINLSRVKTFVMTFDGYKNDFIDELVEEALAGDDTRTENNRILKLSITRDGIRHEHNCVIKDHTVTIQEDTGHETHSLTLTKRGL